MLDPVLLEIFRYRLISVAEEMGLTLRRTAFSPNIKERCDYSCAVFNGNGDMLAQAAHIPVHLGAMPLSVKAVLSKFAMRPGEMFILNDPFEGGTHLPDVTLVMPVFIDDRPELDFIVANRAHHADIGGQSPGSMSLTSSIFQEGLIIPPTRIMSGSKIDEDIMGMILANVRTPEERGGDFAAQIMANTVGAGRLAALVQRYGLHVVKNAGLELMNYSERLMRDAIRHIPDGQYAYDDYLDGDGMGTDNIPIHVQATISGDTAIIDFSESSEQVLGAMNAVKAITTSAVQYVFDCLAGCDMPPNQGSMRPIQIITRPGSIVDANWPCAVMAGNVETSQRIVDVLLGALHQAIPDKIPAASQGTMNNLSIGGFRPSDGKPYAYYETMAGGAGAGPGSPGQSARHTHMTNTLNTPIEALEYAYPMRIVEYRIRRGSGGQGLYSGGDGIIREIEFLGDCEVNVISERRSHRPYGLNGGQPGMAGVNQVIDSMGNISVLPSKARIKAKAGDRIRLESPGGGGYGKPTPTYTTHHK